jgi:FG-GAP-like repeat
MNTAMKVKGYASLVLSMSIFCMVSASGATVFNSPRETTFPSIQYRIASGDLNNDGFLDLIAGGDPVASSPSDGKIFVMLGKGNGNFHSKQEYRVGYSSSSFSAPFIDDIKVADMNNDGNLDVVVSHLGTQFPPANRADVTITVLFGNGKGTLQETEGVIIRPEFLSNNHIIDFELADVNADGLIDIVAAIIIYPDFSKIQIIKNLGGGLFENIGRVIFNFFIVDIEVAKINNDQFVDFVLTKLDSIVIAYGGIQIFPNTSGEIDIGIENIFSDVRDFNGDGRNDILSIRRNGQEFRIFFNSPVGFPQSPVVYQTNYLLGYMDIADSNNDGIVDLYCYSQNNLRIYLGNASGVFSFSEIIPVLGSYGGIHIDFNNDGKVDQASVYPNVLVRLNEPNPQRYYTDFDADGKSDFTIFRPTTGMWWTLNSRNYSSRNQQFGLATDKIINGNYDGDNKTDLAVFRDGIWYIQQSSNATIRTESWGQNGDIPVPADYDNDGLMETAVFRPSTGTWYIRNADNVTFGYKWGIAEDKPVATDYDGDGKADIAVFRPSNGTWYVLLSRTNQVYAQPFGIAEDKPVAADYDGDGKSDIAVFRPSNGIWYILQSGNNSVRYEQFGLLDDIPTPNDYNGDGKNDIAVFRQSEGIWYSKNSQSGAINEVKWGTNLDLPIR